jgi:hypothetical protein
MSGAMHFIDTDFREICNTERKILDFLLYTQIQLKIFNFCASKQPNSLPTLAQSTASVEILE